MTFSDKRIQRAERTLLDLIPVSQLIGTVGVLLVILFTLAEPEASQGLSLIPRAGFWILHVGLGLLAILGASRWLASGDYLPRGTLIRVLLTGMAGIAIAAPGYLLLDAAYKPFIIDLDADFDQTSLPIALIKEIAELTPWFLVTWLLINLPVLLNTTETKAASDTPVDITGTDTSTDNRQETTTITETTPPLITLNKKPDKKPERGPFMTALPDIIGQDIIAVSSDLHYLNVWTANGKTTVLGNLRDASTELGESGMQVHRSHWVAHTHVRRLVGTASNGACLLSNELRIPVSRRRWKTTREQYGLGTVNTA